MAAGKHQGNGRSLRNPETQRAFAASKTDQDVRKVTSFADSTKLLDGNDGPRQCDWFSRGRRGMYGPACNTFARWRSAPASDARDGLVDYALGAAPHTGAFVIVHEDSPLKKAQLAYYKIGDGPFYVFYTPFHLPHIQIASTIGRAVVHRDPTVAPIAGPVCEVVTVAKRDLKAGERLDGIGGYCAYGLDRQHGCGSRHGGPADRPLRRLRSASGYPEGRRDLVRRCRSPVGRRGRCTLARTERAMAGRQGQTRKRPLRASSACRRVAMKIQSACGETRKRDTASGLRRTRTHITGFGQVMLNPFILAGPQGLSSPDTRVQR